MLVIHGHRQDAAWQRRRGEGDGGGGGWVPGLSPSTSDQLPTPGRPRALAALLGMNEQTQTQAVALTLGSSAVRGAVRGSDRQVDF